jgi:hypothetical protein
MTGLGIGSSQGGRDPHTYQLTKASTLEIWALVVTWSLFCFVAGYSMVAA